ncbi:hypothetical protein FGO68_gene9399 [Halteria grandinella]|uniref:PPM-type phosphatase domain-containing protein n=1 Tax=Halteria grandinella TaxID=5974 RepID=A0A8J8NV12_HALGN|nr:hypothetical protein FGO68_gene9399 [Halteria grandinella]
MRAAGQSINSSQLFGVFDGHGVNGHHVSAFVSHTYPQNFQNALQEGQQPKQGVNDGIAQNEENAMRIAFRQTLEDLLHRRPVIECNYSGTTAVVLHIKEDALICANLGDSRAVLATRRNKGEPLNFKRESFVHNEDLTTWLCHPLSKDHKPNDPIEQQRIQLSGGRVAPYCEVNPVTGSRHYIGPARIYVKHGDYPGLAMSRSLGDMVAHSVGASADPDIYRKQRNQEQDKFVIIASDGVWEFVSSEEAIKIVIPFWHKGNPTQACEELTKLAVERWNREESGGSVDDITCIVIFLSHPSVFATLTEQ